MKYFVPVMLACASVATRLVACTDTERASAVQREAGTDHPHDAGELAVDVTAIGARPLSSLAARDLQAVCEAEKRASNTCKETAVRTATTPADCEAADRTCRQQYGDAGYHAECAGGVLWSSTDCAATVNEYLDCVNSYDSALSCDKVGYTIATDACSSLMSACPRFTQFIIRGKPPPCTPEESAGKPPRNQDDVYGADGCIATPARFIVLGDSIADCTGTSKDPKACAPMLIAEWLREHGAPDLVFETYAAAGKKVEDLLPQAMEVAGGPGHIYVWVYAMGNDLMNVYTGSTSVDSLVAGYATMFDYFTNDGRFPDGATFLLNTQYNPKDECSTPGAQAYPPGVDDLISSVNKKVILDVAEARPDAVAIDQLPDFLGHGDNADTHGCPYCGADNTPWMSDSLHPNLAGNLHIAQKWERALSTLTGATCAMDAGRDR